jgi:ABC-type branched-subunit amino acid transport system ATPase component
MNRSSILSIEAVGHRFGGVSAINDCHWKVDEGTISGLIGPNGAGKSTLLQVICGAIPLQKGRIKFNGVDVGGWSPHRIAMQGMVRTFQIGRAFERLTVMENMLVASQRHPGEGLFNALLRPGLCRRAERSLVIRADELLKQFHLHRHRDDYASNLSGGQKRLLELARAVMTGARFLLLDEPMSGINPSLIDQIVGHLEDIKEAGATILLVEHNLALVERICHPVAVMVQGQVVASGSMAELASNPQVVDSYLGRTALC